MTKETQYKYTRGGFKIFRNVILRIDLNEKGVLALGIGRAVDNKAFAAGPLLPQLKSKLGLRIS